MTEAWSEKALQRLSTPELQALMHRLQPSTLKYQALWDEFLGVDAEAPRKVIMTAIRVLGRKIGTAGVSAKYLTWISNYLMHKHARVIEEHAVYHRIRLILEERT